MGLTGGVGSGKSTVADLLAEFGATVIDTDVIAREVIEPGGAAHDAVLHRFGTVDRAALADLIFSDDEARRDLNAIVHPAVADAVDRRLAATPDDAVVVLVVPLLVEAGWQDRVDHVVVVDTPEELAIRRVVASGRLTEADVRRRMAAQATRDERRRHADTVLTNDGDLAHLAEQVRLLMRKVRSQNPFGDTEPVVTPPS